MMADTPKSITRIPCTACSGIQTLQGDFSHDPCENLLSYAHRHLDTSHIREIEQFVSSFRESIDQNKRLDLQFGLLLRLFESPDREDIEALLRDLEVWFLRRRYEVLRMAHDSTVDRSTVERLVESYSLTQSYVVDPEIPKVAAKVAITRLSQWELICFLHGHVCAATHLLSSPDFFAPASSKENRAKFARLVTLLRLLPYEWVEDILLSMLRSMPTADPVETVRLHITVLRALFSHPQIESSVLSRLIGMLFERFDGSIPPRLRELVRAILVSGGSEAWELLWDKVSTSPMDDRVGFFLDAMADIDKESTARALADNRKALFHAVPEVAYVDLLVAMGAPEAEQIVSMWHDGEGTVKRTILQAVDQLHSVNSCSFLISRLAVENDVTLQFQMLDTIMHTADFSDIVDIPAMMEHFHPVLYYHSIDLCYRRMVRNPVMLTRLKEYTPIYHIEKARAHVYRLYLYLFHFHDLLESLHSVVVWCREHELGGKLEINESYVPEIPGAADSGDIPAELESLIDLASVLSQKHNQQRGSAVEIHHILQFAPHFSPRHSDDVFGRTRAVFPLARMLTREMLEQYKAQETLDQTQTHISELLDKAEVSLALLKEYFLYKEWFVRPAPFLLHDGIGDLLEGISRGRPMVFDPDRIMAPGTQKNLRETFCILAECTKQGVYLTDMLLEYLRKYPRQEIPERVRLELTHRRSQIAREEIVYDPKSSFDRHLQFTTFAHIYRYGKESMDHPSIVYLWLRFCEASSRLSRAMSSGMWPTIPRHPEIRPVVGPLTDEMYRQHADDARSVFGFIMAVYGHFMGSGVRIRVIPNISYGLFCIAPIASELSRTGIHISLAGISSRYCDDMNISQFTLNENSLYPVKPYLFSTASNYGTLNHDRILIVIDGTMEPLDRQDPGKIRLPKAHRGYLNHIAAINYVRSRYGYGMDNPEREVASALNLPLRYVKNLVRTVKFKQLVNNLLVSFDREELDAFHRSMNTGKTYYSLAQWNPEGLPARSGTRGYEPRILPCAQPDQLSNPCLLFVSMNTFSRPGSIPAFFDNSPETEKSRIILGPGGTRLDNGWPDQRTDGIVIDFPEGENR